MSKNEIALVEVRVLEGKEENVGETINGISEIFKRGTSPVAFVALHNSTTSLGVDGPFPSII